MDSKDLSTKIQVDVDTAKIDEATKKAKELKELLIEVHELINSL